MIKGKHNFFDVVVIGAGISGLTSAALLSKAGLKVCVLELNSRPGGYLAKFEKNGFVFDAAIHWLNNCGPEGFATKIFRLIGADHPIAQPQKRIKRYVGEDFDYLLTNNPDELKKQIINDFPSEKESIERFFSAAKKMHPHFSKFNKILRSAETMSFTQQIKYNFYRLKFAIPFFKYARYIGKKGKTRGLNRLFGARFLHKMFANEPDLLSCLVPVGWAYNDDFQKPPPGGCHKYPEWLAHVIGFFGNKIIYNARAKKITKEDKNLKSVIYEREKQDHRIFCNQVIAACDAGQLYETMMPEKYVPLKLVEKLKKAEIYGSAFIVYLLLDCPAEELEFKEELVTFVKDVDSKVDDESPDIEKSEISVISQSARDKTLAPKGRGTLKIIMPALFKSYEYWQTTLDNKDNIIRGEKYKDLKSDFAIKLIRRVEGRLGLDLQKHIIDYDVATPVTFWRYTANREGSMMGPRPGRKNITSGVARYKTPLKGLYLSGHWAELGGGVPIVVKAAINSTLLVLKEGNHKAFKLFADYTDNKKTLEEVLSSEALLKYDNSWKS